MLTLVGANLNYSSWTLRAYLALRASGLPFRFHDVGLKTRDGWKERILAFSGAGKVPVLVDGSLSVHESLAIAEYVNELAPEANLWPTDRALRARGRALACEMASGFPTLRTYLPCNVRGRGRPKTLPDSAAAEITRADELFRVSLESEGGPYLLGAFSIADCMYAPLASRFRTYGIALSEPGRRYVDAVLSHPHFHFVEEIGRAAPAIAEYDTALLDGDT